MSVHFISGKPGGGKTLLSVRMIINELVHGSRHVITNVPLNVAAVNEYLQREFPSKSIDLHERLEVLNDETQTPKFWTVRPGRPEIPILGKEDWSRGDKPQYPQIHDGGVLYVIDEIHNFFNARAWMETGRDVLYYLSQHRKLGDTVICITQAIGNVDKQFRSVTQDYTYVRNLNKERMGLFRLPAVFVRKTYGAPATENSSPMESGTFTLDVSGYASLYDTSKGVGVYGKLADVGERRSGLPWWVFVVGIPLLLIAFAHYVPIWTGRYMFGTPKIASSTVVATPQPAQRAEIVPINKTYTTITNAAEQEKKRVVCVAMTMMPGKGWGVALSDGRVFEPGDRRIEQVTARGAVVRGDWFELGQPETPAGGGYVNQYVAPVYRPPPTAPVGESSLLIIGQRRNEPRNNNFELRGWR